MNIPHINRSCWGIADGLSRSLIVMKFALLENPEALSELGGSHERLSLASFEHVTAIVTLNTI
jgi:hypothetical protein